jgi:hypothetical protein
MTAAAFAKLKVKTACIDGELCGVRPDGVTSFEIMQQVSDSGGGHLSYFAFDLLHLDGEDIAPLPLTERKVRLAALLKKPPAGIAYSDHEGGEGEAFRRAACKHGLEGVVSKRLDRPQWGIGGLGLLTNFIQMRSKRPAAHCDKARGTFKPSRVEQPAVPRSRPRPTVYASPGRSLRASPLAGTISSGPGTGGLADGSASTIGRRRWPLMARRPI